MRIRKIKAGDNLQVAHLIRNILEEMGVPKVGTAYADKCLDAMFEAYQKPRSVFYVAEANDEIIGCGGIAPLEGFDRNICELQKMYVAKEQRGKGLATKILRTCLEAGSTFHFEACYLETMPYMEAAQNLYKKHEFQYLKKPLGDTGHTACSVRMLKKF